MMMHVRNQLQTGEGIYRLNAVVIGCQEQGTTPLHSVLAYLLKVRGQRPGYTHTPSWTTDPARFTSPPGYAVF